MLVEDPDIRDEPYEPFKNAEAALDNLSRDIKTREMKDASIVVIGQRMSNLLEWFIQSFDGNVNNTKDVNRKCLEATELIARWEKEFK